MGRLAFAAGFAYSWVAAVPGGAFLQPPSAVLLCLRWVLHRLQRGERAQRCRVPTGPARELFRADAKASEDKVSMGVWETAAGADPARARWLAVDLTRGNAPWIYAHGEPFK
eukprot:7037906-Alexandrium_andersonii.AAC.1